jgi:hypothetical protein
MFYSQILKRPNSLYTFYEIIPCNIDRILYILKKALKVVFKEYIKKKKLANGEFFKIKIASILRHIINEYLRYRNIIKFMNNIGYT